MIRIKSTNPGKLLVIKLEVEEITYFQTLMILRTYYVNTVN